MKNEWKTILVLSLCITLLSQLPLIFGYILEGEDQVFMGIPVHITDANNHLHWMKQASEGEIVFTNKFTHEDVPALIFNPYHFIVGNLARFSGTSILFWYHVVSILSIFGFLLYLYYFISSFVPEKKVRFYSFLFAALGAGFGFFWYLSKQVFDRWIVSADLWVTDLNVFQSFGHPHFTLAMLLMMGVFLHGYKALTDNSTRQAVYAGLFGLVLGFIHIFDIVTVALVLFGWFVYMSSQEKNFSTKRFFDLVLMGVLMSPSVLYYLWIILFNPTYAEWNALNQTVTPALPALLSGFGLLIVFAAIQIYKERKKFSFFSIWAILNLVLVYLPINVQRRFLLGIGIPLAILSAQAYVQIISPWLAQKKLLSVGNVCIFIFMFITTGYLLISQIQGLQDTDIDDFSNVKYVSEDEYKAIEWIEQNINDEVVIISPLRIGNHIPANTNNRVYLGHWAQTIDFEQKKQNIEDYYAQQYDKVQGDLVWNQPNPQAIAYTNDGVTLTYR